MYFGIRISTYNRQQGTYHLLHRCLRSLLSQTYGEWKLFLIGDDYRPLSELEELASMIPKDKLHFHNFDVSPERTIYSGTDLWKVAGHSASKYGLDRIREEGLIHVSLDDDDWWATNHLEVLNDAYSKYPEAAFVYTRSTYKGGLLPREDVSTGYDSLRPRPYNLVHSAASWDTKRIPIDYPHVINEKSSFVAGDAAMWDKISRYCVNNGLKTVYIPEVTVRHDIESNEGDRGEPFLL